MEHIRGVRLLAILTGKSGAWVPCRKPFDWPGGVLPLPEKTRPETGVLTARDCHDYPRIFALDYPRRFYHPHSRRRMAGYPRDNQNRGVFFARGLPPRVRRAGRLGMGLGDILFRSLVF